MPLSRAAALIMAGSSIQDLRERGVLPAEGDNTLMPLTQPIAVKEAVLPFKRFRTASGRSVDSILGPEMRSTGEVMGMDRTFPRAFAKGQLAIAGKGLPTSGTVFISVADSEKRAIVFPAKRLLDLGFEIVATAGTAGILRRNGVDCTLTRKKSEAADGSSEPTIIDLIDTGKIDMVVNTPTGSSARADGYAIRASTTSIDVPIMTTISEFSAAVQAIESLADGPFDVMSLQEHQRDLEGVRR